MTDSAQPHFTFLVDKDEGLVNPRIFVSLRSCLGLRGKIAFSAICTCSDPLFSREI